MVDWSSGRGAHLINPGTTPSAYTEFDEGARPRDRSLDATMEKLLFRKLQERSAPTACRASMARPTLKVWGR